MRKEWVIENYKEGVVTLDEESYDEDTADRYRGSTTMDQSLGYEPGLKHECPRFR